ncbi:YfiR family protein [Pseudomonas corrugata]|uniref:YfiR family protein n=1 Tax=Pseudomonas corrugata TaxID=47879 RepID=UPI0022306B60|nr:YfiR family protein [Pseudomonas corrugata]UZD97781.1 YfiR family protein [Pseudomonas corrugata]
MKAIVLHLLVLATWYLPCQPVLADAPVDERAMKVAYLYNFTLFAQWPSLPNADFQLCVLGATTLDEELTGLNGKRAQNGLPIAVRWITPNASLTGCQVLYVDEHNRRTLDSLLRQLAAAPVLTITDATGFADRGIMIEMRRQGSRVVFDVNLAAARRVNLDFSSRLLKLASFVANRS